MAINPNIPLQANASVMPGISALSSGIESALQAGIQQAEATDRKVLRDLQVKKIKGDLAESGQLLPIKQAAVDSALVIPMLSAGRVPDALAFVDSRIQYLESNDLDATHTRQFRSLIESNPQEAMEIAQKNIQIGGMFGFLDLPGSGINVAQKTDLINNVIAVGLDDSGQTFAIEVGTNKRLEGQEALDRIQKEMQAERDADLKAKKDEAEVRVEEAREKAIATDAISAAGEAFDQIPKIDTNIANLEEAVRLVGDGANTGPIVSMFPSIQQASIELDNLQGRLGLDVVGATTFGALSKGELDLAKNVALPKRLKGPALVKWANEKIEAQKKLRNYLREMAVFLQQGGSRAEWANHIKARKEAGNPVGQATIRIQYDAQGNRIQ